MANLPREEREALGQLSVKVQLALKLNAQIPGDVIKILALSTDALPPDEIGALAVYVTGEIAQRPAPQMIFDLQYLRLQSQTQNENRNYTVLSNIMKTKHDTIKNAISNIH